MTRAMTNEDHMKRYTVAANGCWHWDGYVSTNGYGTFLRRTDGVAKNHMAHRVSYEYYKGPIPEGLVVDHHCHNNDRECFDGAQCMHRRCINPEHLEAVTQQVNTLRGKGFAAQNAVKTHCPEGHEYTGENTNVHAGSRSCKICMLAAGQRYYETEHGGDKKRAYARERMREVRKQPEYQEYKNRKERERYWRNKEKKRLAAMSE